MHTKFDQKTEGTRSLGRPRCRWEDTTYIKMYLNEILNDIEREDVSHIELVQVQSSGRLL
jgi:hypothetical protein